MQFLANFSTKDEIFYREKCGKDEKDEKDEKYLSEKTKLAKSLPAINTKDAPTVKEGKE